MIPSGSLSELVVDIQRWAPWLSREVALSVPVRRGVLLPASLIAVGADNPVRVSPTDVFRSAIRSRAEAVILMHSHRSDAPPSPADQAVTRRLVAAGVLLGLPIIAHLVVGPMRWTNCMDDP
ncbi:JAB domain-containing protein [Protofrankia symbiont of Coriaria ruscifolia]|uniref:RadC-like JAB domain-containing protein n=1 Tax=Candidatus Protofrankia californiensis TaxID=1839754 RepID=A0A1C3NUN4_9ACTN|nr:JAB domain-containing protein [Protofrankia symbiont of Coriaria ruscifolia]SBW19013.1 hypothetical protein FDG2_0919 [Candidatus Protofrankia californiensis]